MTLETDRASPLCASVSLSGRAGMTGDPPQMCSQMFKCLACSKRSENVSGWGDDDDDEDEDDDDDEEEK